MPATRRQSLRRAASTPAAVVAGQTATTPTGCQRGRGRGRGARQRTMHAADAADGATTAPPGDGAGNEASTAPLEGVLPGVSGGDNASPATGVFGINQPTTAPAQAIPVSSQSTSGQSAANPQNDEQTANSSVQTPDTSGGSAAADADSSERPDCGICLEPCLHPVRLPCRHVFCYLCVKGAVRQSGRCCYCRADVDEKYFNSPELLEAGQRDLRDELEQDTGFQWFYQGRNGWWRYDRRTNDDLETAFGEQQSSAQIQVAGELYTVDLVGMTQYNDQCHGRRRRVKREQLSDGATRCKGVAGIRKKQRRN